MENPFQTVAEQLNRIDEKLDILLKVNSNEKLEDDEYLTIEQAAKMLYCSVPTLYSKHSKGEIPNVSKVGKRLLFSKSALKDWIKSNYRKTRSELELEARTELVKKKGRR